MKVTVMGNGAWGTALYSVLIQNNADIEIIDKGEKAKGTDIVVLAVPTQAIPEALDNATFSGKKIIVNTSKGIFSPDNLLPHQVVKNYYQDEKIDYFTLIGPSFAGEVKSKMPTIVNLGHEKLDAQCLIVKKLFQTDYFRVKLTTNVEALELSALFKNIYAIACGLVNGLGYEANTKVKILVLAIDEIRKMSQNLNWEVGPDSTAGTIGDLILTCSSPESRNFSFGSYLAKYPTKEALEKVNSTVEGYHSLQAIKNFEKRAKVKLPVANFIKDVVDSNDPKKTKSLFENFVKSI